MPKLPKAWRKLAIPAAVFIFMSAVVGIQSSGAYIVARDYASRFNFLPKDHLPLADSDCYKWANLLRKPLTDWTDPAELENVSGPVRVGWAAPTRWYLKGLFSFLSMFAPPSKAESWALFFSMPVLAAISALLVSAFCLFALGSPRAAALIPPAALLMPSIQSQMPAGRPDHHGPIILCMLLFLLSMFQPARRNPKSAALFSGVLAALCLWLSPLNFVPVLGVFSLSFLVSFFVETSPPVFAADRPVFWRQWAWSAFWVSILFWLLDYSYRGGQIHMETLNPAWSAALLGGGLSMYHWGADRGKWGWKAAASSALALPALALLASPEFFWTRSEEIKWVLKEVNEMRAGDMGTLFSVSPLVFVALLTVSSSPSRRRLLAPAIAAVAVSSFYLWQVRWLPSASMAPLAVLAAALATRPSSWLPRLVTAALVFQTIWYAASAVKSGAESIANPKGAPEMYNVAMFSAMASRMARERGERVVLSSPNLTSTMFYMNGVRGVGSVYWESRRNLRAASEILGSSPENDARAAELMRKYDIRLVAFTPLVLDTAYVGLAGNWKKPDDALVVRLTKGKIPDWLRPVARVNDPWPGLGLYETGSGRVQ